MVLQLIAPCPGLSIIPVEVRFPGKPHICFYFENKPLGEILNETEINAIRDDLMRLGGNNAKVAKILQNPASTLKSRIEKLNLVQKTK